MRDRLAPSSFELSVLKRGATPSSMEGLARELRVLSEVTHPAFRPLRAAAIDESSITIVLDYVDGTPLSEAKLGGAQLLSCAAQLLRGLFHIHSQGRAHGDLKPGNIVIARGAQGPEALCIIDLELARKLGSPIVGGTPRYMSPEHKEGSRATVAGDLYSFGLTLREVAGPRSLRGRLAKLVETCLQNDPGRRPASADAALAMLGQSVTPLDRLGRPPLVGPRGARDLARAALDRLAGETIVVEGPAGAGRTRLTQELVTPLIARGRLVADVRVDPGHDPLLALAGVLLDGGADEAHRAESQVAEEPSRAVGQAMVVAGQQGIPLVIDAADTLDPHARKNLLLASQVLTEKKKGALVVVGADPRLAEELERVGATRKALGPLSRPDVTRLFEATAAPLDQPVVDGLLMLTRAAPGLCARAVLAIASRGGASAGELVDLVAQLETPTAPPPPSRLPREQVLAEARQALRERAPHRAHALVLGFDGHQSDKELLSCLARAHGMRGQLDEALQVFETISEPSSDLAARASIWLERLGRYAQASRLASPLVAQDERAGIVAARSALSLGDPHAAYEMAAAHLEKATTARTRTLLHCIMSDAALQRGDAEEAADLGRRAVRAADRSQDSALRAQALSRQGAALGLSGQLRPSLEKHREAYETARAAGDLAGLPPYILNVATAEESMGELGAALEHYQSAADLCRGLDRSSALAAALLNQASLLTTLGALDEAEQVLDDAAEAAASSGMAVYQAQAKLIRAELLGRSDRGRALELAAAARSDFDACGAVRQSLEARLLFAELSQGAGDDGPATALLTERSEELDDAGLRARFLLLRARALAPQDPTGALRRIDEALDAAGGAGDRQLQAVALVEGAALHQRLGTGAAEGLVLRAREIVGSVASRLTPGLRERYLAIAPTSALLVDGQGRAKRSGDEGLDPDAKRLLGLVGRLLLEKDDTRLLEAAVDEAVQLSGAERAFLLRRGRGEARVVVARNVDGDAVQRPRFRFSHSVASQVIETGELVVTAHATKDPELAGAASIMDLGLRSILCVPIRAPAGIEAALYLDNRFEAGRFRRREIELVQALSNIIGVALENARLHREDRAKAQALERARAELEVETELQAAEVERLRSVLDTNQSADEAAPGGLVGRSAALRAAISLARRGGPTQVPFLIEGESGTGKELLARFIHDASSRRQGPIHVINCGALSDQLLESELFGHVRGAFTGATRDHRGLFRAAEGGSVFLDEVGEMSPRMQTRLLRVLQEGEVHPVGGEKPEKVDVRVIAATNRHLADEVESKRFRQDLYYRLAGVEVVMPPLRHRLEDVPLLAECFLEKIAQEPGMRGATLSRAATRLLLRYHWPGNVRELQQALRRAVITSEEEVIRPSDLALRTADEPSTDPRSRFDRPQVERALRQSGYNKTRAAQRLGVSRMTLHRWIRRYGVE